MCIPIYVPAVNIINSFQDVISSGSRKEAHPKHENHRKPVANAVASNQIDSRVGRSSNTSSSPSSSSYSSYSRERSRSASSHSSFSTQSISSYSSSSSLRARSPNYSKNSRSPPPHRLPRPPASRNLRRPLRDPPLVSDQLRSNRYPPPSSRSRHHSPPQHHRRGNNVPPPYTSDFAPPPPRRHSPYHHRPHQDDHWSDRRTGPRTPPMPRHQPQIWRRSPSPRVMSPRRPSPRRLSPRRPSPRRLSPRRPSPRRPRLPFQGSYDQQRGQARSSHDRKDGNGVRLTDRRSNWHVLRSNRRTPEPSRFRERPLRDDSPPPPPRGNRHIRNLSPRRPRQRASPTRDILVSSMGRNVSRLRGLCSRKWFLCFFCSFDVKELIFCRKFQPRKCQEIHERYLLQT